MGLVFNIQKFCIHDGDGIRTCVFLKGCPLRCIWCHNPESLDKAPVLSFNKHNCTLCGRCTEICDARKIEDNTLKLERKICVACGKCAEICLNDANEITGREMTAQEVLSDVLKDKMFYDTSGGGITVTGGEPSYQPDFTLELLSLSKEAGISIAIETCGAGSREFYEKALSLGTTFLYDIKCIDPVKHKKLTGADNTRIIENLRYLMDKGADIIIRIPMIPQCNDSDEDIIKLCSFLEKEKGRYRYAEIMPYHSMGTLKAEKNGIPLSYAHKNATDEEISRWVALFNSHGTKIKVSE